MPKSLLRGAVSMCAISCAVFSASAQPGSDVLPALTESLVLMKAPEVQEKPLYSTDFSDWGAYETKTKKEETKVTWPTKYSHEQLTFTVYNTQIGASNFNTGKFPDWEGGMLMCAKSDDPYIITSPLSSITTVDFRHGATGSKRGWALWAKGDGDADWVLISDAVANPAAGCDVHATVDRTNVQLKFTNINASQNAYLLSLDIHGNVDMSASPMLGAFSVNGVSFTAAEIFEEDSNGNMVATIEVSKAFPMVSAENPLTGLTADNGTIGDVTYESTADNCVVTIPVTAGESTTNYVATFVFKPDFTLSYYDTDGNLLATQTVEKDAAINTFAKGEADVTIGEGMKFRGWHADAKGGRKYTTEDVVTADMPLYAIATAIEGNDPDARYDYNLTDKYFYVEDHEAFVPAGGEYHDGTHGWAFGSTNSIELTVAGDAYIVAYVCRYTDQAAKFQLLNAQGEVVAENSAYDASDGKSKAFRYTGPAGKLSLVCSTGYYLHRLAIINVSGTPMEQNAQGYYMVTPGDANSLLNAIDIANATSSEEAKTFIFIPNGTYDLGTAVLTNISGSNISLIGESMEGTVIVNHPEQEGIGVTATIYNTGKNTYMQDLTLQNAYPYYVGGMAGRAVCLQDKGTNTICKNVRMLSYQDTYYSNAASNFYWETSEIHGTVDFICGDGDAYFNECTLVVEPRNADGSGECTLTAPSSSTAHGYVFNNCTIDSKAAKFNFGRAWSNAPKCAYINTTILQPSRLNANRWTAGGMNVAADRFVEYNTMDAEGNVISPESHVMKFTKDKVTNEMETILSAEQAAEYTVEKVYGEWNPAALAAQVAVVSPTIDGNTITWSASADAAAYMVMLDGNIVAFTSEPTYTTDGQEGLWTVRVANTMGGFGEAAVAGTTSIISVETSSQVASTAFYSLQGHRVGADYQGVVIRVDTLTDGTTAVSKVVR